jgi:hypothetical protein
MTRKRFCEKYGFPLDSITALERGKYSLNREMAQRIASATGVSFGSLLLNQTPLLDWNNSPVTPATRPPSTPLSEKEAQDMRFFLKAATEATKQSKARRGRIDRSTEFGIMFREWIMRAVHDLGAEEPFWGLLFGSWTEFEPDEKTLHQFNPNVLHLSRTSSQLPSGSQSMSAYRDMWSKRNDQLQSAEKDVVCEALPKKDRAKLREYLDEQDQPNSRRTTRTPKQVEELLALHQAAHFKLAEKHGMKYEPDVDVQPLISLIHHLALKKLAANGAQLAN